MATPDLTAIRADAAWVTELIVGGSRSTLAQHCRALCDEVERLRAQFMTEHCELGRVNQASAIMICCKTDEECVGCGCRALTPSERVAEMAGEIAWHEQNAGDYKALKGECARLTERAEFAETTAGNLSGRVAELERDLASARERVLKLVGLLNKANGFLRGAKAGHEMGWVAIQQHLDATAAALVAKAEGGGG